MENKLWILRPVEEREKGDDPWEPWYDKYFGFIICAPTEEEARTLAHMREGNENSGKFLGRQTSKTKQPWLDCKYSTCVELKPTDETKIIMDDYYKA